MSEEFDYEQFLENQSALIRALGEAGFDAVAYDRDITVSGSLADLLEFCRDWRSEIEELEAPTLEVRNVPDE